MARQSTLLKSALTYLPEKRDGSPDLEELRMAAKVCEGCDLYKQATQTVFGSGGMKAEIFFIGEQPGDKEDLAGEPFVGPAGQLLNICMEEAGIDRGAAYVTNAVKHFKWEPRGKIRLHKKPSMQEVAACRPWLEAEINAIRPKLVVCLGATAAQSLLGSSFRVTQERGKFIESLMYPPILATVHPSSILRAPDEEARHSERGLFVEDLKKVAAFLRGSGAERK